MQRKVLQVQVELEIQAVTCPGVWLCPSGQVSLQMYMIDSYIQTAAIRPIFPLLYHEKFIFYKVFDSARNLSDVQRLLNRASFYGELIQWQNCEGNVIASFQSSLGEILFPSAYDSSTTRVDIDLLMEPTKNFPGIIAPKIEVNTRTVVEEIFSKVNPKKCRYVANPKVVPSEQIASDFKQVNQRQQRVCHSIGYHKSRRGIKARGASKPPFMHRRVDEQLISRKPELVTSGNKCGFCTKANNVFSEKVAEPDKKFINIKQQNGDTYNQCKKPLRGYCPNGTQICHCGNGHVIRYCPVCCRYNRYFKDEETTKQILSKGSPTAEVCESSLSKNYPHHSFVMKVKPCTSCYLPTEPKTCACSPTSDNKPCNKICCSLDLQKPTLAEQIHNRIKQTFDCTSSYVNDSCYESPVDCDCSKFTNCKHRLSRGIGKFYRDLQKC